MFGRGLHRSATLLLSVLMAAIGIGLIVEAIVGAGHGSVSLLALAGVLFLAAGVGRLYVERKRGTRT
jgi:predicted membrane channel-forming protein YqfA (hemolysin III family)